MVFIEFRICMSSNVVEFRDCNSSIGQHASLMCIWLCSGMRAIQSPNFLSIDGNIWSRGESLLGEANELGNIGYFCSTHNFLVCPFTYQKHLVLLLCFLYYPMNSTQWFTPRIWIGNSQESFTCRVVCYDWWWWLFRFASFSSLFFVSNFIGERTD